MVSAHLLSCLAIKTNDLFLVTTNYIICTYVYEYMYFYINVRCCGLFCRGNWKIIF